MGNYFLFFFMFFSNFQNFCKYILLNYTCWCNIHFHGITRPILGKIVKKSEFVLFAFFPSSFPQRVLLRPRFINPLSSSPHPQQVLSTRRLFISSYSNPLIWTSKMASRVWLQLSFREAYQQVILPPSNYNQNSSHFWTSSLHTRIGVQELSGQKEWQMSTNAVSISNSPIYLAREGKLRLAGASITDIHCLWLLASPENGTATTSKF